MSTNGVNCVSVFFNTDSQIEERLCEKLDECIAFEDENNETLYNLCVHEENCLLFDDQYDEEMYDACAVVEENIMRQVGGALKRVHNTENVNINVKRARYGDEPTVNAAESSNVNGEPTSESINDNEGDGAMMTCSTCHVAVKRRYFANHLRSNLHKMKLEKVHSSLKNVSIIESAFGQRIISYKIHGKNEQTTKNFETPELFMNSIKNDLLLLIEESIQQHTIFKVNFVLHADFIQQTKEDSFQTFDFQTYNYIVFRGDDLNILFSSLCDTIASKISSFEKKDSGWSLKEIKAIDMNVNKFNPLRGTSYIELPKDIRTKKAIVNVKNADNLCFKWALLSALYPVNKNADRVSSYTMNSDKLKFDGVRFPVKLSDISKVEKLNNISINVFGLEFNKDKKCHSVVGPLFLTKFRKDVHVNLLLISNGANNHYCYIKNMSRLVSKQISNQDHAVHICDGCLLHFPTNQRLTDHQQHDCTHIATELPNGCKTSKDWYGRPMSNDKLKFDKYNKKLKIPFVIYADFEAFLNPINSCFNNPSKPYTSNTHEHEPYSFGYYIKCSYDDTLSKYETYSGKNCAQEFMNRLHEDLKNICRRNSFQVCPKPLTVEEENEILIATICHICESNLDGESTIDYDWQTGCFRGVAHEVCATKFRSPRHIPVFFHNLSNYDAHFIVHALNFVEGEIDVIPQTKEKYISFSKTINVNNQKISLRFVDSLKFLSCSLDQLAKNLCNEEFKTLKQNFPKNEDFIRLRKKGIYPYEFMSSEDSLKKAELPNQDQFYSSLSDSHVSDDDYNHAKDIWQHFQCRTMLDYSNLYLKTDVLLLTDVFESFRTLCLKTYGLDPAHYYTAPGLSWDAMLKFTQIELELLTDFEKVAFIKAGIRGGVSQCSNRHAKANNEYMEDYDKDKLKSYLTYLDANNLYGWAMSQCLPVGGFEWVNVDTNFDVSENAEYGFILEVDLEYPVELHDLHSDLPLCPENIKIGNSKDIKLVPNLNNKTKYKIHYRNLKQCIEMGMKLIKVHRILKFKQRPWLKDYIDLNTTLRTSAKSDFEKDFYKLMNNSVFGKTMENIEKRVNVKLLTHWENRGKILGVQDLVAKPEFHSSSTFGENLVAVQLRKMKLFHNKPIYLGFCILDISKTLMYDFHYNFMIKKFNNNIKLLYTDTDSLIYHVFTNNFYEDIKPDLSSKFDTSDYPDDNIFGYPKINKKKLGFFKDENNGKIFREFVGLRSKMYALDVESKFISKAKGVKKCVTKNMNMENYKSCLFDKNIQYGTMVLFKSLKHKIFTQQVNKICLSFNDSKRFILPNNVDTLAWGHYKLR